MYWDWVINHAPMLYLAQELVASQIQNYIKFPPRQKAASFNLDTVMASLGPAEAAYAAQKAKAPGCSEAAEPATTK